MKQIFVGWCGVAGAALSGASSNETRRYLAGARPTAPATRAAQSRFGAIGRGHFEHSLPRPGGNGGSGHCARRPRGAAS